MLPSPECALNDVLTARKSHPKEIKRKMSCSKKNWAYTFLGFGITFLVVGVICGFLIPRITIGVVEDTACVDSRTDSNYDDWVRQSQCRSCCLIQTHLYIRVRPLAHNSQNKLAKIADTSQFNSYVVLKRSCHAAVCPKIHAAVCPKIHAAVCVQ